MAQTDRPTKPQLSGMDTLLLKQTKKSISRTLQRLKDLETELAVLEDPEKRQARKDRMEAEKADLQKVLTFHMNTAKDLETGTPPRPEDPKTKAERDWQFRQIMNRFEQS